MIFLGLGANLPTEQFGTPLQGLNAALTRLESEGITLERRSSWYRSAPVPPSSQPWYYNGVAAVASGLAPQALLAALLRVEAEMGRVRRARNAPRVVDLDLLDYHGRCLDLTAQGSAPALVLPHPRMAVRAFVLFPLHEIDPEWRHPESGETVSALIDALGEDQAIERIQQPPGL